MANYIGIGTGNEKDKPESNKVTVKVEGAKNPNNGGNGIMDEVIL